MKARYVQTLNPKSKTYVKIDRKLGKILGHKRGGKPYKNIIILSSKLSDKDNNL